MLEYRLSQQCHKAELIQKIQWKFTLSLTWTTPMMLEKRYPCLASANRNPNKAKLAKDDEMIPYTLLSLKCVWEQQTLRWACASASTCIQWLFLPYSMVAQTRHLFPIQLNMLTICHLAPLENHFLFTLCSIFVRIELFERHTFGIIMANACTNICLYCQNLTKIISSNVALLRIKFFKRHNLERSHWCGARLSGDHSSKPSHTPGSYMVVFSTHWK